MTNPRGRIQPTSPQPYPGNDETFAGVYSWNNLNTAINPLLEIVPAQRTPLAVMMAAYQADQQAAIEASLTKEELKARERRQWQIDTLDEHELFLDIHLARLAQSHKLQRHIPAALVQANLNSQPKFIRKPLQQRIDYLRRESGDERANTFLTEIVESALSRLDAMRKKQQTVAYQHIASRERLDDLLRLPELNQKEVKTLATMVAAHMDMLFDDQATKVLTDETTPDEILQIYQVVASEAARLCITPPYWYALNECLRRRGEVPYHLLPGALARLRCAEWWYRKLWRLRSEWREEQLRAVLLVHKHASAYISYDALTHKREQYRRMLDFIRSHEFVNDEGVTLDMETVVNASTSNPRMRRNEMMTTMKGLENLAEMRSDCAVFYTITCPSQYHATLANGKPNPKWTTKTVRESSDYLVDLFSGIRKKMHRMGLRWYGMRVAEAHHDGTVHWHLMCFMRKKHRTAITKIMRDFAIRKDRAELGDDIKPRFTAELITKRKGSPTSYIAKYISKNVDGRQMKAVIDKATGKPLLSKETGKPLGDMVENAVAWASLHRVRQFQFFGIPSRQAYRELRLLAGQLQRKLKPKKGAQLLPDKKMDDVLAAADAGCFATYIHHQGGVLIPRKYHTVRTAYAIADVVNDYGEHSTQIYGIWSPRLGEESRVCTHSDNWKMVAKPSNDNQPNSDRNAGAGFDVGPHGSSPSLGLVAITVPTSENGRKKRTTPPPDFNNFDSFTYTQRRELRNRLREEAQKTPKKIEAQPISASMVEMCQKIDNAAQRTGWILEKWEISVLARGGNLVFPNKMTARLDQERWQQGEVKLIKSFDIQPDKGK
ncbi:replication endonuclease [Yersinia enterocolitica]|uniref:replication endonuclease n=1 Tax=Yersinia enterocolitica TaxID=630 RepID=UPI00065A89AA|nr:replication endonuclease [Yersinia enterocolitica]CRY22362.1 phage replication protein (endonuclease) [Yersinia enterocolitica]